MVLILQCIVHTRVKFIYKPFVALKGKPWSMVMWPPFHDVRYHLNKQTRKILSALGCNSLTIVSYNNIMLLAISLFL